MQTHWRRQCRRWLFRRRQYWKMICQTDLPQRQRARVPIDLPHKGADRCFRSDPRTMDTMDTTIAEYKGITQTDEYSSNRRTVEPSNHFQLMPCAKHALYRAKTLMIAFHGYFKHTYKYIWTYICIYKRRPTHRLNDSTTHRGQNTRKFDLCIYTIS